MEEFISRGNGESLRYEMVPFTEPMLILFSSGTTGNPKAMVHSHGVCPISCSTNNLVNSNNNLGNSDKPEKGACSAQQYDCSRYVISLYKRKVLSQIRGHPSWRLLKIGWTMWNIFLGGLLAGASLLLYDGSPFYPSPEQHVKDVVSFGSVTNSVIGTLSNSDNI